MAGRGSVVPGQAAPEVRLKTLDGVEKTSSELRQGRPLLLAFFKIGCPVCQFTFPFLERLAKQDVIHFIGVSQDDEKATREFAKEFGVSFPMLLDERRNGYQASNGFGITHVPTLFLIEEDGTITWTESGFSKSGLEALGNRTGRTPFEADETVPQYKAG
jgi:peroxiredoxin